jgi:hypothetical protein
MRNILSYAYILVKYLLLVTGYMSVSLGEDYEICCHSCGGVYARGGNLVKLGKISVFPRGWRGSYDTPDIRKVFPGLPYFLKPKLTALGERSSCL